MNNDPLKYPKLEVGQVWKMRLVGKIKIVSYTGTSFKYVKWDYNKGEWKDTLCPMWPHLKLLLVKPIEDWKRDFPGYD